MVRAETAAVELFADGDMQVTYQHHESRARESDMCDVDYPLGNEGTCDCADSANHQIILQEEMCVQAAFEAGVSTPLGSFRLQPEWTNHHPKGCFKDTCSSDPKGQCYFFNPIGNLPAQCAGTTHLLNGDAAPQVTGVPVCRRAKYLNGTADTNGGCPDQYGVIMNENNCSEAATCLGDGTGSEFRVDVLNESQHDHYPLGCFVNSGPGQDGKVYFNAPLAGRSTTANPPTNPLGTPICNVTVRTYQWWRSLRHERHQC